MGLGLRSHPGGHCLEALGLTLVRREAKEVSRRLDEHFAVLKQERRHVAAARLTQQERLRRDPSTQQPEEDATTEDDELTEWMTGDLVVEPMVEDVDRARRMSSPEMYDYMMGNHSCSKEMRVNHNRRHWMRNEGCCGLGRRSQPSKEQTTG